MSDETTAVTATTTGGEADESVLLGGASPETPSPGGDAGTPGNGEQNKAQADAGDGGKTDEAPAGAPEKYELQFAEGVTLDEALLGKFEPVLRELNLTNEQAQQLANTMAEVRTSEATRMQAETQASVTNTINEWRESARTDAEIGGAKLQESLKLAARVIERFGGGDKGREALDFLEASGAGNHPALIRVFARIGRSMAEDGHVSGEPSAPAKTLAARMFPNLN